MKNLKNKYSSEFSWIYPIPGDWHLMKNFAEMLRDIIIDGGFKEFLGKMGVGRPEGVFSWQDLNLYLLAIHESLHTKLLLESGASNKTELDEWIRETSCTDGDEVTQFWTQYLSFLDLYVGYYFSIRSGNWHLRNACLKQMIDLFFSYSKPKYEQLCTETLYDILCLPQDILMHFQNGEWTVSLNGFPYHNLALDEAQECVINKRLKVMTTRPSHFRTVQLADFCAYMDKILQHFEKYTFKYHKNCKKAEERVKPSSRAFRLLNLLNEKSLFSGTKQILCNIFSTQSKPLSESAKKDLLSIIEIGQNRFMQYLKQYFLQVDPKEKRDKKKLHTFSEKKTTKRGQRTKLDTATVLLRLAYRELESNHVNFIQTSPYPLALCTEQGGLRKRSKSAFKNALLAFPEFKCMFVDKCPLCPGSLEIILDFFKYMHEPVPPNIYIM